MTDWWNPVWGGTPTYHPCSPVERVNARIGGITWMGTPGPGTAFVLRSLSGWWSGGAWSGGGVDWDNADGGVEGDVFSGGRVVTLRGLIYTPSGAEQMAAFDRLAAVWAVDRWQTLIVDEPERGLSRQMRVAPRDLGDPQPISDQIAQVTWMVSSATFPLVSPTQKSAVLTSGGVSLSNDGTYPAALTVLLEGPLTNPGLSWSGGSWRYSGSVPSGTTLQVDMERRTVWNPAPSSGAPHSRNLAAGTWLLLPPGLTKVSRTGSGSGTITARWRSAWA